MRRGYRTQLGERSELSTSLIVDGLQFSNQRPSILRTNIIIENANKHNDGLLPEHPRDNVLYYYYRQYLSINVQ